MTREDAIAMRKKTGTTFFDEPNFNYEIIDLYRDDVDVAWIMCAKYFWNLQRSPSSKVKDQTFIKDGDKYFWVSCDVVISRLWYHGIRSRSTVSKAFKLLCYPSNGLPPVLLQCKSYNHNGHPMVYYAETDVFRALFSTDGSTIEQQALDLNKCLEDNASIDNADEGTPEESASPAKKHEPFALPAWWNSFYEKVQAFNKYTDNIYKDDGITVNGYVVDAVKAIDAILDGTFYSKPEHQGFAIKYDLSGASLDSVIDGLGKCWVPDGGCHMKDVIIPFYKGKNTRKSRLLEVMFGKTSPVSSKPAKFIIKEESYEPGKKEGEGDRSPSSIWFGENNGFNERPDKYYPELTLNHPRVWGLYHAIKDYAASCKSPEGIWTKHNKPGTTVSDIDILYWVLRVASEHGCTSDDIFQNIIIGDDSNYLWALVIQYAFNNNRYKLARDEKKSSYLYCGAKDLNHSMYTKVVGKGAKK